MSCVLAAAATGSGYYTALSTTTRAVADAVGALSILGAPPPLALATVASDPAPRVQVVGARVTTSLPAIVMRVAVVALIALAVAHWTQRVASCDRRIGGEEFA